jgi:hypothetical protein
MILLTLIYQLAIYFKEKEASIAFGKKTVLTGEGCEPSGVIANSLSR